MNNKPTSDKHERRVKDRRHDRSTIQELEKRFSDIIDFLPDATFAIDQDGKVIAWNRAIEEMSGISAASMVGRGNYEYAVPLHGIRRPMLIDLVLRPDEEFEKQYSFIKREGEYILAESTISIAGENHILWGKAGPSTQARLSSFALSLELS